jgi:hypothetical protein
METVSPDTAQTRLAAMERNPATQEPTLPPDPPTPEASPTAAPLPLDDLRLDPEDIYLYPVPFLYEGDLVTIQVVPDVPRGLAPNDVDVHILIDGTILVTSNLSWRSINGDTTGLYQWAWDTNDLAGDHTVTTILDPEDFIQIGDENPENNQATITVTIRSRSDLPEVEADAVWVTEDNDCCTLHVIEGTAAHRDLPQLLDQVDAAFRQASNKLAEPLSGPYHVYLIDRVLGHGGYANNGMVVSYLDRDYTGGGLHEVLTHEAVHLIDPQFAPNRITALSEGLAVWTAGGHYQQENLGQRMAALVEMGRYIPISQVIDDFYEWQHETSYLEAASLTDYLVETYGWEQTRAFYSETTGDDADTLSEAVSVNLQKQFDRTLEQVEGDWMAYLARLPRDPEELTNLQTTLRFYDVVRRYQSSYDPTAYYLSAWLPSPVEVEMMGNPADFSRHPESATHIALETILLSANDALLDGDYDKANALLDSVVRVLSNEGRFLDPLSGSYLGIVKMFAALGLEVQQIGMHNNEASVMAVAPGAPVLVEIQLEIGSSESWRLTR